MGMKSFKQLCPGLTDAPLDNELYIRTDTGYIPFPDTAFNSNLMLYPSQYGKSDTCSIKEAIDLAEKHQIPAFEVENASGAVILKPKQSVFDGLQSCEGVTTWIHGCFVEHN